MAHGIVILECPRTPQSEVWARSYVVLSGALPRDSAQLCECCGEDNTTTLVCELQAMSNERSFHEQ